MQTPRTTDRTGAGRRRRWLAPLLTAALAGLAGCSTSGSGTPAGSQAGTHPTAATAPAPTTTVAPTTTTTTEQPGWIQVSSFGGAIAVDQQPFTEPDGHLVTVVRFRAPQVTYALHVGSTDPPRGLATIGADAGPAIGPDEAPYLLAAFNGGFEVSAGVGGFELDGQTVVPLQAGLASLVIDADGSAHVGVWGQGLPTPGEQVASVRQNLPPWWPAANPLGTSGASAPGGPPSAGAASSPGARWGRTPRGTSSTPPAWKRSPPTWPAPWCPPAR